ncbi:MAG: DUF1836 domain-containing protein [Lachnospiraceae bacterium]|nr:DUF1836 domain-containing protein [Lachnospiraceae bacterium]
MTMNMKDFLSSILKSLHQIDYVKPEDLPNIDLYMDQVTTFMDSQLEASKRHPEDKILTKTMINNYAKNNLLPPPEKKKYSKEHILCLIFIYYFKNILSIGDIQRILNPITDQYFGQDAGDTLNMTGIYQEVFSLENEETKNLLKDLARKYNISQKTFLKHEELSEKEREFLQKFAFICELSFDVYIKKMLIEKIIDSIPEKKESENRKKKAEKSEGRKV